MILLNQHLKKDYAYSSSYEMFPHLYDKETGRQYRKICIYFDETGENIIVQTDGLKMPEIVKAVEKFIKDESEKALKEQERLTKAQNRLTNILNTIKEAKGE